MRKQFIAVLVALAAVATLASPAQALDHVYVSGAGEGFGLNYKVPVLAIFEGDTATYVNADIAAHNVRAAVLGPDRAWCTTPPFNFASGRCPLFSTALIGLGQTSPIFGLSDISVPPGETSRSFPFVCTLHGWMQGTLIVVATS